MFLTCSFLQYLFCRFNSKTIKLAGTISFLLTTTPYMAVVLYGPAIALSSVIRISIPMSILVVGVIVTFYTSIVRKCCCCFYCKLITFVIIFFVNILTRAASRR